MKNMENQVKVCFSLQPGIKRRTCRNKIIKETETENVSIIAIVLKQHKHLSLIHCSN